MYYAVYAWLVELLYKHNENYSDDVSSIDVDIHSYNAQ